MGYPVDNIAYLIVDVPKKYFPWLCGYAEWVWVCFVKRKDELVILASASRLDWIEYSSLE